MAFEKRTWLARLGQGLNKFFIGEKDAEGKQELTNAPDSITQQGDVISADNLNDLEDRIDNAIKGVMMGELVWENPNPNSAFAGGSGSNISIPIVSDLPSITHRLIAIEYEVQAVSDQYQAGSIGAKRYYFNLQKDNTRFSLFWDILDFNPQGHYYNRRVNFTYVENLITISHGAGVSDNATDNTAMVPLRVYLF